MGSAAGLARLLAMGGILLFSLVSCDVLFMGFFPASATQATARVDLSSFIDAGPANYFSLFTISAGGSEHVILFTSLGFDSSETHLLVMDPHLKVQNTYTLDELDVFAGGSFSGNAAMTDANGQVAVGNVLFNSLSSGLSSGGNIPTGLSGPSLSLQPMDAFNEVNYQISGGILTWTEYDSSWTATGFPLTPPFIGTPAPPPQGTLRIVHIFNDQDSMGSPVLFVFRDDGSERTYFLPIPRIDLENDLNVGNVFATYPPPVSKTGLSGEAIGFSRQGVIAYERDSESLVRFALGSPGDESRLPLGKIDHMQLAAGISGTYCVVWDPASRMLTRYEQWW